MCLCLLFVLACMHGRALLGMQAELFPLVGLSLSHTTVIVQGTSAR